MAIGESRCARGELTRSVRECGRTDPWHPRVLPYNSPPGHDACPHHISLTLPSLMSAFVNREETRYPYHRHLLRSKYASARTMEYLVDDNTGGCFFLEMSPRLQVERRLDHLLGSFNDGTRNGVELNNVEKSRGVLFHGDEISKAVI